MRERRPNRKPFNPRSESGIALVLVLFIVALCTVIVTQMTYTSTLDTTLHLLSKRSLEAEYLLKSVVNVGRAVIKTDISPEDAEQDTWGQFRNGLPIPPQWLEVDDPSVRLELEIRPEESKLPIKALVSGTRVNDKWRDVFSRFFKKMEFDSDGAEDGSGLFPGRVFTADEVVANLIDYMDSDKESYQSDDFVGGVESEVPEGSFANRSIRWQGQLYAVPGMNADRIRRITPFITSFGGGRRININLAPRVVLESLHPEIGEGEVNAIIELRSEEPFTNQNRKTALTPGIIGDDVYNEIASMIDVRSRWFQIVGKVDYGASTSFMRSYVSQTEPGELPIMRISEIF